MNEKKIIDEIRNKLGVEISEKDKYTYNNYYSFNEYGGVSEISIRGIAFSYFNQLIDYLKQFDSLKTLILDGLELQDISRIAELKKIRIISLKENQISDIASLANLENLEALNLSNNPIANIQVLENLYNLKEFYFSNGLINDINFLKNSEQIEILNLRDNEISDISIIAQLRKIQYLNLRGNKISDIEPIKELKRLRTLFLANNPITRLPKWITDFNMRIQWIETGDINFISFYNNPFESPPVEIVSEGKNAIRDYFKQIDSEMGKIQYLFEAKLLVIGEGGSGKTSFIRKIQNADAAMPLEKDTTLGIQVGKWSFTDNFPQIEGSENVKFHLNLWDFGGQRIYQGTHQIFFSDKSLYVLIDDTREQKTDFSYWLNTVEQLGGATSFLIIVLNKKFGHEPTFDEAGYRSHFPKIIKEVISLDLQNDRSMVVQLQDKVKMYLKLLPGIGDPLPPSWVSIREDLLNEGKYFISFERFRAICKKYNVIDPSMIRTLSGYFNRIGAFTHYIDDPLLQERIYLDSNWLVKTVYDVLDNSIVKEKRGKLIRSEVKKIWEENELNYEIDKLAQLMHNFGLMYHIPGSDQYVIPAHLPPETPYVKWPYNGKNDVLQFIYEFDKYMPKGIMSRLIVALHHHIKNHELVWQRGVNIESDGANSEIIESYGGTNRYEIRISGTNKIELLAIIRERFAEVLKPFNNLKYNQLVPCICNACRCSNDPAFHDYDLLLRFREKGAGSQCRKTGEMVNAAELLKILDLTPKPDYKIPKGGNLETVRIFLASSSELADDRKAIREFISIENDNYHRKGIYFEIVQWEHFIDKMSKEGLQSEYNKAVEQSDIFLSLFFTKVGKYTSQEFESAFGSFRSSGRPVIYTYFKKAPVDSELINKSDTDSKHEFEEKLKELNHYKTIYTDINDFKVQFKMQIEKLYPI